MLAKKLSSRIFGSNDLFRVERTTGGVDGTTALPPHIRPWIFWLVALIKCGCEEIRAPLWAIAESHYRSCPRSTRSKRSAQRALSWLVEHDYIQKRYLRSGIRIDGLILSININRFSYFLKKYSAAPVSWVAKHDEMCDTALPMTPCRGDKISSNTSRLQVKNIVSDTKGIKSKKHAGNRTVHRHHPIIHTLWVITAGEPDRWHILSRARAGLRRRAENDEIRWDYWDSRWRAMTHAEREMHAANEILPSLRAPRRAARPGRIEQRVNAVVSNLCGTTAQPDDQDRPPAYQYDPTLSPKENEQIKMAQIRLFWARKNMNIA